MKYWLWFAIIVAIGAAWMFRYDPVSKSDGIPVLVWDRWLHRPCIVGIATSAFSTKLWVCKQEDLQ